MNSQHTSYTTLLRTFRVYTAGLIGIVLIFCLLHWFFPDSKAGGVYWFNLDKERNAATWFSGVLFFLFGCAAIVAFYWETRRETENPGCFRLPWLWLLVGLAGCYFSLDEVTILHENLLWRETRQISSRFGDTWKYVTQWQILFAPAILSMFAYFIIFFANRYRSSKQARYSAFAGLVCWFGSLTFEGLRGFLKLAGRSWYLLEVMCEEAMEMMGAIFLLGSMMLYVLDIAVRFDEERRAQFQTGARFLTKRAIITLGVVCVLFLLSGAVIYLAAQWQAETAAPVPRLIRKALSPRQ
ncbi:MAG: hypothetical protein GY801_47710 [bacterium]|nr:hypothetical protein [bacterium]